MDQPVTDEKIEDVKIEALRADIENKFVYALLLETHQLRHRLAQKEKALSALQEKKGGPDHAEVSASAGKLESDIEQIMGKIVRLEMTLDNLTKKLGGDIEPLAAELVKLAKPGISDFFSDKGRYYRMLSSELGTKQRLLDVIGKGRSPSGLRMRSLTRPAVLVLSAAVVAVLLTLSLYPYVHNATRSRQAAYGTEDRQDSLISQAEVLSLLDDIRQANLNKDLELWKSRYSASYLSSKGREDNIIGQWEKVDFTSLEYTIEKFEFGAGAGRARATITWYMGFKDRRGADIKMISERLHADFAKEDGRLKITSVKQAP